MEKGNHLYHLLDRWVGIPVVFSLGLLRRKNHTHPVSIRRIAVLNLGSIGDNVLMSAVMADLRSQYPQAKITVFAGGTNYSLVQLIEGVDFVIRVPVTKPTKARRLIRDTGSFDVLFDFGPWPRLNAIYSSFVNASFRAGFKSPQQLRHFVYDLKVPHSSELHEIDNYRNLIRSFYTGTSHQPTLIVPANEEIDAAIAKFGSYCIIHPWPGGYKSHMKQWANERWAALMRAIESQFDCLVVTGGPSDIAEARELHRLLQQSPVCGTVVNVAGTYSLAQTVRLIQKAKLVISINTGISHIAAALQKPQVCIQGPTNAKRWAPYSTSTIVVTPSTGTFGYLNYGFEYHRAKENCMDNISVQDTLIAIEKLMGSLTASCKLIDTDETA